MTVTSCGREIRQRPDQDHTGKSIYSITQYAYQYCDRSGRIQIRRQSVPFEVAEVDLTDGDASLRFTYIPKDEAQQSLIVWASQIEYDEFGNVLVSKGNDDYGATS